MPSRNNNEQTGYLMRRDAEALYQSDKTLRSDQKNLSLIANLYVKCWAMGKEGWNIPVKGKEVQLKEMASISGNVFLDDLLKRAALTAEAYGANRSSAFEMKQSGGMIVGLGGSSPLEVSITLHPVYGIPFIPATAVKGVARSWAENHAGLQDNERKSILLEIFGSGDKYTPDDGTQQAGNVIFFDAYPKEYPTLELDVMTPHYSEYYTAHKVPADWYDPVPVQFLTVRDAEFLFHLAVSGRVTDDARAKELLARAKEFLTRALTELGIGAKTNSGYGFFKSDSSDGAGSNRISVPEPEIFRGKIKDRETIVPAKVIQFDKERGNVTVSLYVPSRDTVTFHYQVGLESGTLVKVKIQHWASRKVEFAGRYVG